jgi:hypothetical protein
MSAVHRPNLNFDNEHKEHVPYQVVLAGELQSSYKRLMQQAPTSTTAKSKKHRESAKADPASLNRFFKK